MSLEIMVISHQFSGFSHLRLSTSYACSYPSFRTRLESYWGAYVHCGPIFRAVKAESMTKFLACCSRTARRFLGSAVYWVLIRWFCIIHHRGWFNLYCCFIFQFGSLLSNGTHCKRKNWLYSEFKDLCKKRGKNLLLSSTDELTHAGGTRQSSHPN